MLLFVLNQPVTTYAKQTEEIYVYNLCLRS